MQKQVDRFAHSVDGLLICRHCGRKFSRWPQLLQHKHIGSQLCPVLYNDDRQPGLNSMCCPEVFHAGVNERLLPDQNAVLAALKARDLRYLRHGDPPLWHLAQRCHLCNQWMAHPHFVKTHVRRSHDGYWRQHEHSAQLLSKQYAFVLGTSTRCSLCNAQARCKATHAWRCSIFFQICMAAAANEMKGQKNVRQLSLEQILGQPTVRRPLRLSAVGLAVRDTMQENIDVPTPALAVTAKCCFCDVGFRRVREVKHRYKHRRDMLWNNFAEKILLYEAAAQATLRTLPATIYFGQGGSCLSVSWAFSMVGGSSHAGIRSCRSRWISKCWRPLAGHYPCLANHSYQPQPQQQQLQPRPWRKTRQWRSPTSGSRTNHVPNGSVRRRREAMAKGELGQRLPKQELVGKDKSHQNSGLMGLVQSMGRLVLRQEDELSHLRADRSYVLYFNTDRGVLPTLFATSKKWKTIQETEKRKLDMSLCQTLIIATLLEWRGIR